MKHAAENYDLDRMKIAVEGPESKTALRLVGPQSIHDILNAFSIAYKELEQRDRRENERQVRRIG